MYEIYIFKKGNMKQSIILVVIFAAVSIILRGDAGKEKYISE